jgi:hypothetical protein
MRCVRRVLVPCVGGTLLAVTGAARAAIITDSPIAPVGPFYYSQPDFSVTGPPGAGTGGGMIGSQDYTDNGGPPGQTFRTPVMDPPFTTALLTSVTIRGGGDAGGAENTGNFHIQIGRVDPVSGAITELDQEAAPANTITGSSDYLTFTLANPVTLNSAQIYSFSIYSDNGWFGLAHSSADVFTPGTAFDNDQNTTQAGNAAPNRTFNGFVSPRGYDYTFYLTANPAPEPGAGVAAIVLTGGAWMLRHRRPRV